MKIQEIIEKNKGATILIDVVVYGSNNETKFSIKGTGFVISTDGKFITNAHVYKQVLESELKYLGASVPGKVNEKKLTPYDRYPIKLLNIDEENDIALMQIVSDKKFETVDKIGDSEKAREGDEVV